MRFISENAPAQHQHRALDESKKCKCGIQAQGERNEIKTCKIKA